MLAMENPQALLNDYNATADINRHIQGLKCQKLGQKQNIFMLCDLDI